MPTNGNPSLSLIFVVNIQQRLEKSFYMIVSLTNILYIARLSLCDFHVLLNVDLTHHSTQEGPEIPYTEQLLITT